MYNKKRFGCTWIKQFIQLRNSKYNILLYKSKQNNRNLYKENKQTKSQIEPIFKTDTKTYVAIGSIDHTDYLNLKRKSITFEQQARRTVTTGNSEYVTYPSKWRGLFSFPEPTSRRRHDLFTYWSATLLMPQCTTSVNSIQLTDRPFGTRQS